MRELLAGGRRRVHTVWMAEGLAAAPVLDEIADLARGAGVGVTTVPRSRLDAEADTAAPQGVLARADPVVPADLDALLDGGGAGADRGATMPPFLLAFDGVTDPHNVGALLRSARGAGATGALLGRHRGPPLTPALVKAAAGAVEHLPLVSVGGIPAALATARDRGLWVVGLDAAGADLVFDLAVASEPLLVVVGAEGSGLSRLVRRRCHVVARIPLAPGCESLNVAAAGAVTLFEVARHRSPERFGGAPPSPGR